MAANDVSAHSVRVRLDCWNGLDSVCGDKYVCSSWSGWTPACSFSDPVPSGYKVTRVEATANGIGCSRSGGVVFNVKVNGNVAGSGALVGCATGTCSSATGVSADYGSGFPDYVYGGVNALSIDPAEHDLCLANVDLTVYYEEVTTTTTTSTSSTTMACEELQTAPEFGSSAIVFAVLLVSPVFAYLVAKKKE